MRDILAFCGDILSRLHANGFPEAIVAGGAIRDVDNGREHLVKDIDVVIFDRPGYVCDLLEAMEGFQHRLAVAENVANYLAFENVACVWEFWEEHNTMPIQVVVAKTPRSPMDILERHDFGLCQIGYNGRAVIKTKAYLDDQRNHTFTLVRCRDVADYWRSAKRFQRLETKYIGWKMIDRGVEGYPL